MAINKYFSERIQTILSLLLLYLLVYLYEICVWYEYSFELSVSDLKYPQDNFKTRAMSSEYIERISLGISELFNANEITKFCSPVRIEPRVERSPLFTKL